MSAAWASVRGMEKFSLCDWPGRNACVFFLAGCSLRCPTCHNAALAWSPLNLPLVTKEIGLEFLRGKKHWLDGLVISGGEPTERPELTELIDDLASVGLPIKLDTNGLRPNVVAEFLSSNRVQAVSVDVKGPFGKYPELTGHTVSAAQARACLSEMFDLAGRFPSRIEFRTTLVPALSSADIGEVKNFLPRGTTLKLQQYIRPRHNPRS